MALTIDDVKKAAQLSRLRLDDSELERHTDTLGSVLGLMEKLGEVDTQGTEPLANVVDISLALRPDAVTDGDKIDAVLKNAPEQESGFFVVSKVVE